MQVFARLMKRITALEAESAALREALEACLRQSDPPPSDLRAVASITDAAAHIESSPERGLRPLVHTLFTTLNRQAVGVALKTDPSRPRPPVREG